jgi:hypothetical protein
MIHVVCKHPKGRDDHSRAEHAPDSEDLGGLAKQNIGEEDENDGKKVADACDDRTPDAEEDLRKISI